MELLEIQLTSPEGQVAVFQYATDTPDELSPQLHALANVGLFEVCIREYGDKVWTVLFSDEERAEPEVCDCGDCSDTPKEQRPAPIH